MKMSHGVFFSFFVSHSTCLSKRASTEIKGKLHSAFPRERGNETVLVGGKMLEKVIYTLHS